jgi:hypothetical protein
MGQHPSGNILESVHAFEKIGTEVITHAANQLTPRGGHAVDMFSEDDQSAAVGHHGFQFVHDLSGNPDFFINGRGRNQHRVERFVLVQYVQASLFLPAMQSRHHAPQPLYSSFGLSFLYLKIRISFQECSLMAGNG